MKKNKDLKNFLIGLGVLLLYLVSSYFSDFILLLFGVNYNNMPTIFKIVYNIAYEVLLTCIIVFIYREEITKCFKVFMKNNKRFFDEYIKYLILSVGLVVITNLIITFLTGSKQALNQEQIVDVLGKAPIYTFILTVIIAPITEELVFRLSFRKMIAKTDWLFVLVSGVFFGSMHVITSATTWVDYLYIIPYSIPGIIFAITLKKSKNIFVPMSLHFINNGVIMSMQLLLMLIK